MQANQMFVPDFNPLKMKVNERQPAPWHTDTDAIDDFVSTYQRQFTGQFIAPRSQIRPRMAYPWKEAASEGSAASPPLRSSASDSYLAPPASFVQPKSTKPPPAFERAAFTGGPEGGFARSTGLGPNTSTSRASYVDHAQPTRAKAFYPKSQRGRVDDGLAFQNDTTQSVAYQVPPGSFKPRQLIRPSPNGVGLEGDGHNYYHTTAQAAFVAHQTERYQPAPKPQASIQL